MPNKELRNFIEKLEKLVSETENETIDEIKNGVVNGVIEDMNVFQLKKGQSSSGDFLPQYSEASEEIFGKKGRIKLKETGEFYDGITAEVHNKQLQLISRSRKFLHKPANLGERYGHEIIGLTKENLQKIINDYLIPNAQKFIKNFLK